MSLDLSITNSLMKCTYFYTSAQYLMYWRTRWPVFTVVWFGSVDLLYLLVLHDKYPPCNEVAARPGMHGGYCSQTKHPVTLWGTKKFEEELKKLKWKYSARIFHVQSLIKYFWRRYVPARHDVSHACSKIAESIVSENSTCQALLLNVEMLRIYWY